MQTLDYIVLVGYFATMIIIGIICSLKIKAQEDYFMGGRGFGKLLQTFAAFGAGTGSQDPINVGRTTWTSGLSGIWSALMWLFITPFYWIFGVWYRRMRHLTLGDWFVERFESKSLGVAYTVFAFTFYIFYLSTMFSAISKVASPLLGEETIGTLVGLIGSTNPDDLKFILVPIISIVVIAYGILGGLAAAYWTDLIQGLCIIVLSIILIPYGLSGLVDKYGDQYLAQHAAEDGAAQELTTFDGFKIMHSRVTEENFQLFGGPRAGEFPLHYIVSLTLLGLIGIVVQPHFIATGGGSAKTENSARIGLVVGNFLKRLCTIGWALTGLIVLALLADSVEIAKDPDQAWGVASREILGQLQLGLVGLMLACLLAALMSSADCYMLVTSALVVRHIYAAFINPNAEEKTYVTAGRAAGLIIIIGAASVSLIFYDVFAQYKLALEVAAVFAAPFWIGMFWRRATRQAAWLTIAFSLTVFFIVPYILPSLLPDLASNPRYAITNDITITTTARTASPADVAKREAALAVWEDADGKLQEAWMKYRQASRADESENEESTIPNSETLKATQLALVELSSAKATIEKLGNKPELIRVGDSYLDTFSSGGAPIFWAGITQVGTEEPEVISEEKSEDGKTTTVTKRHQTELKGAGRFNLDYLIYHSVGMDLRKADKAMLTTLRLPPRLITPFIVMILLSLITKAGTKETLDRYYVKMKTPVDPDPELDQLQLEESYQNPTRFDDKKLFPGTNLEVQRPTTADTVGFLTSCGICFVFLALAYWLANLGS